MIRATTPFLTLKRKSRIYQGDAAQILAQLLRRQKGRVLFFTDRTVQERFPHLMEGYPTLIVGQGERAKNLSEATKLYPELMRLEVDRSWWVVAVGGGVVCDLAGFVASTYMRGLNFGFVPTTLLAQVDASVGGKNGVNVRGYKNMVGCFSQPNFVICDSTLLLGLPPRERRAGMAEVIKAAIIGDKELFDDLAFSPIDRHTGYRRYDRVVRAAIEVKASIVQRDEKEQGERKLLNLGHTFGHAIEKRLPTMNHGEAVAVGIIIACRISEKLGLLSAEEGALIARVIGQAGLPLGVPPYLCNKLLTAMRKDKKRAGDKISVILPKRIGECVIYPMSYEELTELFPKECGYI